MEHAEVIVKEWLQKVKKQFTMENILYPVNFGEHGSNYSDIDVLATDTEGNFYDYEVKWAGGPTIGATQNQSTDGISKRFNDDARIQSLKEIGITNIGEVKKILVVPHVYFGVREETKQKKERELIENGVEVVYFDDVIDELMEYSLKTKKDDSTVVRLFRSIALAYPEKFDGFSKVEDSGVVSEKKSNTTSTSI